MSSKKPSPTTKKRRFPGWGKNGAGGKTHVKGFIKRGGVKPGGRPSEKINVCVSGYKKKPVEGPQ